MIRPLAPRTRFCLRILARAHFGDFTFLLRDAEASVAWKTSLMAGPVSSDVCAASVDLLVALREALGGLQLNSQRFRSD